MSHSSASRALWKRSAIALGAGLCIATTLHAQQTSGSISGRAGAGAVVTIESKAIGVVRQVTASGDGGFQASQLPPGTYTVTVRLANGTTQTQEVMVAAGQGSVVDVGATQQVVVTGTVARKLDVKSTESTTILSKAELDHIPTLRDTTSITLLAPGANAGDGRIGLSNGNLRSGNVASLGGASPAENSYYINGFNVTNIVNGIAFSSVPYEGVAFQEVKTGGYGAEYGRSLGGVVSVTTKRGTDEWHGGANIAFEPSSVRGSSVYALKNATTGAWDLINRPGDESKTTYNLWGGGPLIKDKLYAFALVTGADEKITTFGNSQQSELKNTSPQYLLKLDWNINRNNLVELTAFNDKSTDKVHSWRQVTPYQTPKGVDLGPDDYNSGGQNTILKWTGFLTDTFTLSALAGQGEYSRTSVVSSAGCPFVRDERVSPRVQYGCATSSTISDPLANDKRDAYRVDAEWALGKHTVKFGLDSETYKTRDGTVFPGTTRYQIKKLGVGSVAANGYTNNTGAAIDYVEARTYSNGGSFTTENSAWYVEDSFQATPRVLLSLGLRSESFTNKNASGTPFIKVNNTLAPRIGASWDVTGKSDLKVYGNAGRYYIPVYANTNVRLAGQQLDYSDYFVYGGSLAADKFQVPVMGAQLGGRKVNSDGTTPDPRTIVDPNIKPLFQDEFIAGFQKSLNNGWSYGVKYTYRTLKSAMDDICAGDNAKAWALANGYSAAQAGAIGDTVDHCFLANPGKPLTANVDLDGTGTLTPVTIPANGLGFTEKPKRTYNAFEFTLTRAWDKVWSFEGTYVLSYSKGNTEGYVKSDIGQDDAGISQDWDYPGLMEGAFGYLPNDRRHSLKLFGSYAAMPELRLGASVIVQSGRPKNCLGYYTGTLDTQSVNYGSTSFYCNKTLVPRGTAGRLPWTHELNLQATYTPMRLKGATFSIDILNVFNARGVRAVQEEGELSAGTPDPNYGIPQLTSLQKPRRIRLLAQYEF